MFWQYVYKATTEPASFYRKIIDMLARAFEVLFLAAPLSSAFRRVVYVNVVFSSIVNSRKRCTRTSMQTAYTAKLCFSRPRRVVKEERRGRDVSAPVDRVKPKRIVYVAPKKIWGETLVIIIIFSSDDFPLTRV